MKSKILLLSIVFILTTFFSSIVNANPINLTEKQKGIIGTWQIKKSGSEAKKGIILSSNFSPETLTLAAENDFSEITINEGFKEFVQTNTLPTDGTLISKNIFKVGKVLSKASWQGKNLIVEIQTENGDKITETFELSANKKQLFVTIQLAKKNSKSVYKIRSIYNRIADDDENNTAQIGITTYPL